MTVVDRKLTISQAEFDALPPDRRPQGVGSSVAFQQDQMTDWGSGLMLGFLAALLDENPDQILVEENGTTLLGEVVDEKQNICKDLEIECEAYIGKNKEKKPSPRQRWRHIPAPAGHALAEVK